MIDWDKIKIFYKVSKAGSFTAAGEKLNLSQSAVSRQISQLEEGLGVALFHRHARGLLLTEQGEILQKVAEDILKKLMALEGTLSDTRQLPEGPLVVTVSNFIGSTWLAPKIRDFTTLYPDIQLSLLYDDKVLNLGMREADAAIRLHKPEEPGLIPRHLATLSFHLCASRNYLAEYGAPESKEDLKRHRLIGFPPHAPSPIPDPNWLFTFANIDPDHDNNILMVNSQHAISIAVLHHAGIAVLPAFLIRANPELEVVLPAFQRPPVEMYFVYAEERRNSKRINAFRDFLLGMVPNTLF